MRALVLRPMPGAARTAARLRAAGLDPAVVPLFAVEPVAWTPPAGPFDALLVTSAAALRLGGDALGAWLDVPLVAVGAKTAAAARRLGFSDVVDGGGDAARAAATIAGAGHRRVLHLAGADRVEAPAAGATILRVTVYAARELPPPAALDGLLRDAGMILVHSARAAARLAALVTADRGRHRLVAISPRAAAAAGQGWASISIAPSPTDEAMVAVAAMLVVGL